MTEQPNGLLLTLECTLDAPREGGGYRHREKLGEPIATR
jgi:hypothetical protein